MIFPTFLLYYIMYYIMYYRKIFLTIVLLTSAKRFYGSPFCVLLRNPRFYYFADISKIGQNIASGVFAGLSRLFDGVLKIPPHYVLQEDYIPLICFAAAIMRSA